MDLRSPKPSPEEIWYETPLGSVVTFLSGGTPSKANPAYWGGSIPWVSAKDMKSFRLWDSQDHITPEGAANGTRTVPRGSVLLLTRGMTLLNSVPVCLLGRDMAFNQDIKALRPGPPILPDYLPYLVLGNAARLKSLVDLAGHGTGRLNSEELKALNVQVPPANEQRAIARILGTLDDKIELNRHMNETLETMARALFKSWFVDFEPVRAKMEGRDTGLPESIANRFPSELAGVGRGDEEIPIGWSTVPLNEVADFLNGLALQKHPMSDAEHSLPVIKIAELRNGVTAKTTRASTAIPTQYVISDGDFLFSWSGSLMAKFWTGGPGALNQHLFKVTSSDYPAWFYTHWVQHHLPTFREIAAGKATTMGHIQRHHLAEATTVCPLPRFSQSSTQS